MTRLRSADVSTIPSRLMAYDEELLVRTGHTLRQIACHAVGLAEEGIRGAVPRLSVALVPIRWGQGVIEGFCEATAAILNHLGFDASVTGRADVSGMAEACEAGADAMFLADDDDFVALNLRARQYIHNADATGRGFAAGLDLMSGGVAGQKVLVLGCGRVGRQAAASLLGYGARVCICDSNSQRCREFKSAHPAPDSARLTIESDLHEALSGHKLIVDATNAAEIIRAEHITAETLVAAPGMPLGLTRDAVDRISNRLLHDPLQLGVATMGMAILKQRIEDETLALR